MEPVGPCGVVFYQFTAVCDQHTQVFGVLPIVRSRKGVVPEADLCDYQRVYLVGFGLGTAPAAETGGQLRWRLPDIETGRHSSDRYWAAERAGPLNRYPGGLGGLCPVNQLTVTGRGVSDVPVLQGGAQVIHQTGRKGILVRVDPDNHWFSPIVE